MSGICQAEVTKFQLEAKRMPFQRDYFYPDSQHWQYHLDLLWDVRFWNFFWENDIAAKTAEERFRDVAWEYKVGVTILPQVDVLWHHRSQHALDYERDKFPVRDSYGVRINFLK